MRSFRFIPALVFATLCLLCGLSPALAQLATPATGLGDAVRSTDSPGGGLKEVSSRVAPPNGPNYVIDSPYASMGSQEITTSALHLSPANSSQPSTMCGNVLPTTPHEDLSPGLYADDAALQAAAPIESTIGCTYSTNLGGYDQHVNNAASTMVGCMHCFIGSGLAIDHITLIGSHSSFTVGDCMNSSIIGATRSQMRCARTASGLSQRNSITGGSEHTMDFVSVTVPSNASNNNINGGFENRIIGSSNSGTILGGYKNAIDMGNDGPAYGAVVSGFGSKVFSADRGDGTLLYPASAEAHGRGARSWLTNTRCFAGNMGGEGGSTWPSADSAGTAFAEIQECEMTLGNNNIALAVTEELFLDAAQTFPIFTIEKSVWHISGRVLCTDTDLDLMSGVNPSPTATFEVDHAIFFEAADGQAQLMDNAGTISAGGSDALPQIMEYTEGGNRTDITAAIVARDGTASLNGGFTIEVTTAAGSINGFPVQCVADLDVTMHTELP